MFIISNKYLINKFNNEIQKNNLLKSNIDSFNSCKVDLPHDSYYKLNTNIHAFDSCKVNFPYDSYYKYQSKSPNIFRNNDNNNNSEHLMTENLIKNKNNLIEKKLKEVEKKIQILKKENDEIINKYESELLKLINRNKELSKNSIQLKKIGYFTKGKLK